MIDLAVVHQQLRALLATHGLETWSQCARVEVWTHRPGDRREVSVSVSAISDTYECELGSAQTVERALAALDLRLADRGRRPVGAEADLRVEVPAVEPASSEIV